MTHEHHAAKTLGIGKAIAVLTSGGDAQGKEEGPALGEGLAGRPCKPHKNHSWEAPLNFLTPSALACRTELSSLRSSCCAFTQGPGASPKISVRSESTRAFGFHLSTFFFLTFYFILGYSQFTMLW